MYSLIDMCGRLFIFILLVIGSFTADGTFAFAQTAVCEPCVTTIGDTSACSDYTQLCVARGGRCSDAAGDFCTTDSAETKDGKWMFTCQQLPPGAQCPNTTGTGNQSGLKNCAVACAETPGNAPNCTQYKAECKGTLKPGPNGGGTIYTCTDVPMDADCPSQAAANGDAYIKNQNKSSPTSGNSGTPNPNTVVTGFQPMAGVPGLDTSQNYTFVQLINRLYIFLIAIGAVIGVIKIAFAGVKWATSASGGSISAAKEDIKGVLLGLIILMVPYIVLSIINPKFTNLDVLKLDPLNLPAAQSPGGGAPPNPGAPSNPEQYTQQCPGACTTYTPNGCAQYEKDCKAVPGIVPPYTTRGSKVPEFIHVCKVKPGTPSTQCPPGNGSTPGPQCEATGRDDCDDCPHSCSPDAEKPADNCVAWEQKCKSITGAYVDKTSKKWECEIPEEPEETYDTNCAFLKDLGTP